MDFAFAAYTTDTPLVDASAQIINGLINLLNLLGKINRRCECIDLVIFRDMMKLDLEWST